VISGLSENTRYKNLDHFGLLTKILQKDWIGITEIDLRTLVANIMTKHGENGKESGYSLVLGESFFVNNTQLRFIEIKFFSKKKQLNVKI